MGKGKIIRGQAAKKRVKEANKRRARNILLRPEPKRTSGPSILSLIHLFKKGK